MGGAIGADPDTAEIEVIIKSPVIVNALIGCPTVSGSLLATKSSGDRLGFEQTLAHCLGVIQMHLHLAAFRLQQQR